MAGTTPADVLSWFRDGVIGKDAVVRTPYGAKKKLYFDYTASGLAFGPIEDLIRERVLPYMANTHTDSNFTGHYITSLYKEAHDKVRRAVKARSDDVVIFTGSGCTAAVNKLIGILGLRIPDILQERFDCASTIPLKWRPLVIRSRMEHHSNDLPWRETIADTEYIGYDKKGRASWRDLEEILSRPEYRDRPMKIGTFSAASNVTGVLNEVDDLARVMHDHGGYAFFDYAAAGPYVDVDIHPDPEDRCRKDAVFISVHKFAGGPQSPGILVANENLFRAKVPAEPGGGTVLYTSPWGKEYRYVEDLQDREEGGTPPIVQVIRAGLAFDLKELVGVERIREVEDSMLRRVTEAWRGNSRIRILGPDPMSTPRLGVMSLVLDGGRLHHNLAVRLLNDLYGIQVRGGCMCAGTYGHDLLSIDRGTSKTIRDQLDQGMISTKPGWIRVSFSPATTEEELRVLIEAVPHVADHWPDYAGDYEMDPATAHWRHRSGTDLDIAPLELKLPEIFAPLGEDTDSQRRSRPPRAHAQVDRKVIVR